MLTRQRRQRSLPRVPLDAGRRAAREYLRRETPALVERQIGWARGDLQYRLAEATRQLVADLRRRYADSTRRLVAALGRADAIRSDAGRASECQLAQLAERERAVRRALSRLDGERL